MRVLVVDDDRGIRSSLDRALRSEGYEVVLAADGRAALAAVDAPDGHPPDAVILDVMMPELDGLSVCRELRRRGHDLPILVLTARHSVGDRVAGLDAGADDYVVKPFALEELLARLRALLRRAAPPDGDVLDLADLVVDPSARSVVRSGQPVELTRTEFDLLELLVRNAGIVLTRDVIMERVWGYDFPTTSNSLEVYVGYLRRKTEAGDRPRLIHTVRGVGYVAREP
ncbi:MAG TPA: response regulator transcription factor [Acidimicrobiia bacterium]|nr:response regulator transcription factor [Acidimicrobiia bacterium]